MATQHDIISFCSSCNQDREIKGKATYSLEGEELSFWLTFRCPGCKEEIPRKKFSVKLLKSAAKSRDQEAQQNQDEVPVTTTALVKISPTCLEQYAKGNYVLTEDDQEFAQQLGIIPKDPKKKQKKNE